MMLVSHSKSWFVVNNNSCFVCELSSEIPGGTDSNFPSLMQGRRVVGSLAFSFLLSISVTLVISVMVMEMGEVPRFEKKHKM
jgi:hypothetical protein